MNNDFLEAIRKRKEKSSPFVVVTLVNVRGSAPQEVGARMIVDADGLNFGTIGGGKLEARGIEEAKDLLQKNEKTTFVYWNLQQDIGMTCGGVAQLFFEKIDPVPTWKIAVFGAGHVAQELIPMLLKLDCHLTCVDPRIEWLAKLPEHSRLHKRQCDEMPEALKDLDPKTFIVSLTMGHAFDLALVKEALTYFDFPYVASIGSQQKANALRSNLKESGLSPEKIAQFICPIGEPFGNNQPAEVAFSIIAQLLLKRDALVN